MSARFHALKQAPHRAVRFSQRGSADDGGAVAMKAVGVVVDDAAVTPTYVHGVEVGFLCLLRQRGERFLVPG